MIRLKQREFAQLLARKNKSQRWLANRIGLSSGYVSQLSNGLRNPSPEVRQLLMDTFGVDSFDDLFEVSDEL